MTKARIKRKQKRWDKRSVEEEESESLASADNVVISIRQDVAHICSRLFLEAVEKYSLKTNLKKTVYLENKTNEKLEEIQIKKVEILETKKYG